MPIGGDQSTESERCLSRRSSMQQQGRDAVIHQRTFSIKPRHVLKCFEKRGHFFSLPAADALKFFTGQKTNSGLKLQSRRRREGKKLSAIFWFVSFYPNEEYMEEKLAYLYPKSLLFAKMGTRRFSLLFFVHRKSKFEGEKGSPI